jgi:hypothetical protein
MPGRWTPKDDYLPSLGPPRRDLHGMPTVQTWEMDSYQPIELTDDPVIVQERIDYRGF